MLTVEDCRYLFQTERVLFNCKGAVDGTNTIAPAQSWVAGKLVGRCEPAYQLCNFRNRINDCIRDLKGWLFVFHNILAYP